jgi:hypothetical protein
MALYFVLSLIVRVDEFLYLLRQLTTELLIHLLLYSMTRPQGLHGLIVIPNIQSGSIEWKTVLASDLKHDAAVTEKKREYEASFTFTQYIPTIQQYSILTLLENTSTCAFRLEKRSNRSPRSTIQGLPKW